MDDRPVRMPRTAEVVQSPPRRQAKPADPCAMVIFGATGDLTERLVIPALYNLSRTNVLPEHFALIGVALKRRYRDVLIGFRADVRLAYLKGDETLIARRIATRHERLHAAKLASQPIRSSGGTGPGRATGVIVSIEPQPREIVAQILSALNMVERAQLLKQKSLRSSVRGAWTNP